MVESHRSLQASEDRAATTAREMHERATEHNAKLASHSLRSALGGIFAEAEGIADAIRIARDARADARRAIDEPGGAESAEASQKPLFARVADLRLWRRVHALLGNSAEVVAEADRQIEELTGPAANA